MEGITGHCGKCGAPYFQETGAWHSILPPPARPTCMCWNQGHMTTDTKTGIPHLTPKEPVENEGKDRDE